MAACGTSDRDEEATWQRVGRPIVRAISVIDLHLSEEGYVAKIRYTACT